MCEKDSAMHHDQGGNEGKTKDTNLKNTLEGIAHGHKPVEQLGANKRRGDRGGTKTKKKQIEIKYT
jgi:hypothetical protein